MGERQGNLAQVAAVIVNYRTPELTLIALESLSLARARNPALKVVVVDGGSQDGSAEKLEGALRSPQWIDWVTFLPLPINGGFGWANNQAILSLTRSPQPPDYVYLINPDARIEATAIDALANVLDQDAQVAAVGSLLINDDGSQSGSAFRHPSPGREFIRGLRIGKIGKFLGIKPTLIVSEGPVEADWVTGASVMLRVSALADVGLFDSGFFLYFEEVELMWRLRKAGWKIVHQPASRVHHIGGAATKMTYNKRDLKVAPPLPHYWFASRRRMFALTRGVAPTVAANILWLAGHSTFWLLRLVGFKANVQVNHAEGQSLLRHGIWPTQQDRIARPTRLGGAMGTIPAWMDPR